MCGAWSVYIGKLFCSCKDGHKEKMHCILNISYANISSCGWQFFLNLRSWNLATWMSTNCASLWLCGFHRILHFSFSKHLFPKYQFKICQLKPVATIKKTFCKLFHQQFLIHVWWARCTGIFKDFYHVLSLLIRKHYAFVHLLLKQWYFSLISFKNVCIPCPCRNFVNSLWIILSAQAYTNDWC